MLEGPRSLKLVFLAQTPSNRPIWRGSWSTCRNGEMKVLITGGAGFIGYNLVNSIKKSHEVVIFDNEFRGSFGKFADNKIKFIKGDITKLSDWEKIPLEIDSVFHLGAINGTKFFYEIPQEVFDKILIRFCAR